MNTCLCGCGKLVPSDKKYIKGHFMKHMKKLCEDGDEAACKKLKYPGTISQKKRPDVSLQSPIQQDRLERYRRRQ